MSYEARPEGSRTLKKARTGIAGLDEILQGGLPAARPTLVCGGPGCGKTTLAMEFLVNGAREFDEPGLFVSFEENPAELIENFNSMGFDLGGLIEEKKLKISFIGVSKGEALETGAFSLDALLIRLEQGIAEVGAKRIVLDTMEVLFSALSPSGSLRTEIAVLFQWLRTKGLAAVITGERGKEELTRYGFEEYISDCVLLLDHRISEQTSMRRLRVIKYRGSAHAADEFPFLIGETGVSVIPVFSLNLDYVARTERVSSGVADIDEMLDGKGFFKATSVLVTGRSGTGKSSIAASFASAACQRGERCLYFSFEESSPQIVRNMGSIGVDLDPWIRQGLLTVRSFRPSSRGLEEHLVAVAHAAHSIRPACVVLDPVTSFVRAGGVDEVRSMLTRTLDLLKRQGSTLLLTGLTSGPGVTEETEMEVSSLIDTWIALDVERTPLSSRRTLYIVKTRGMEHSQDTRQFLMSSTGLSLRAIAGADRGTGGKS